MIRQKKDILNQIKADIRTIPNWPKYGVMFKDITTLLKNKESFKNTIDLLFEHYKNTALDMVVGIESRGFIIGAALAYRLNVGFAPIRKAGKLPAETMNQEYELEYGKNKIEIHIDAIQASDKILVVDDLIATGGTALAAGNLITQLKGEIAGFCFVIDLPDLGGSEKLKNHGYEVFSLVEFDGE